MPSLRIGKATKVNKGKYMYKGFEVNCFGYYEPEHRVVWEGVDKNIGKGIARGYTKSEVMSEIDCYMQENQGGGDNAPS
jgi:hypothetical protein